VRRDVSARQSRDAPRRQPTRRRLSAERIRYLLDDLWTAHQAELRAGRHLSVA